MNGIHVFLIVLLGSLVGCGGGDDNGGDSDLVGTWKQDCRYIADDETYDDVTLTFSGNSFTLTGSFSEDANCSTPVFSSSQKGTFKIGAEKILTSGDTVKELDVTSTEVHVTLHDELYVGFFNTSSTCNKTDWKKDVEVDVLGCDDFGPDTIYDIYKVDGNKLYLGDSSEEGVGESSDTRPTELDSDFFTKS